MCETFHIEEFKALRAEIDARVKEGQTWESLAITATAAVYAWLATNSDKEFSEIGWWIPVLFPLFGMLRHGALLLRIVQIAEYIRSIEETLANEPLAGWERHLLDQRKRHPVRSRLISFSSFAFWATLLILTIWIALEFTCV